MAEPSLPADILGLPIAERIELVELIWNSIAAEETSFELSDAHKAELDRRLAARKSRPETGKPWEEVKQRLLGE